MTASRNRLAGGCLLLFLLAFPALAPAQGEDPQSPPAEQPRAREEPFELTLGGRRVSVERTAQPAAGYTRPATGAPLEITPSPYLDKGAIEAQIPELSAQGRTPPPAGAQPDEEDEQEPPAEFEASELPALDPGAIGLLGARDAAYPVDLWQGSRPGRVITLLGELPAGSNSPTANAMARRLLLSPAPLPEDETGAYGPEVYIYTRLERLAARGDLASLLVLFEQIPRIERSPRIARLMVDAYLLDGDLVSACQLAERGQREEGSGYWLKVTAICHALAGEEGRARFNVTLLQETGEAEFTFINLLEDVIALRAEEDTPPAEGEAAEAGDEAPESFFSFSFYLASDLTPLHVGVLKVLGREVEIDLSSGAPSNLMLSALARWPGLSLEAKLEVADIAVERGILRESFLRDLVASYRFDPEDKANPYLLDFESWGVKGDALFYALALEAEDADQAARYVQEGWSRARQAGRAPFIAGLYQEALDRIPPALSRLSFAPDAVRIALLNGRAGQARQWYSLVRSRAGGGDAEATRMLVEMWPLMTVTDLTGEIPYSPQILRLWRQSLSLLPPEQQMTRSVVLYAALEALGHAVPEDLAAESQLTAAPAAGEPALQGASQGETIVLALNAYGRNGPDAETLAAIMAALEAEGMDAEARRLALDALLARGF